MFDEELRGLNQHWRRRTNSDYRPAVLGTAFGIIADPDHPGYVFIREQTSNGLSAPRSVLLPSNVPIRLVSGTKVKLGFDEQDREIILGGDTSGTLASGLSTVSELQRAQSPRNNQVSIETLSVIPTSPASLSVFVKAWSVIVSGIYSEFPGINSGDLTLPSSGDMYYAVLFIESDYTTLDIEYSTARGIADFPPLGDDDIQECIDASPINSTAVWAIPLNGDMTAIQLSDIMAGRDLRQMVNTNASSGGAGDYILIQDQKSSGTDGGTFTSGSWQTRTLNTIVADTTGAVSLASNQFVLPAGTYRFRIDAICYAVDEHKCKLYNITDAADVTPIGLNGFVRNSTAPSIDHAIAEGRFTIAGSKTFEVQHKCNTTKTTNGFGFALSFGTEVYCSITLIKE